MTHLKIRKNRFTLTSIIYAYIQKEIRKKIEDIVVNNYCIESKYMFPRLNLRVHCVSFVYKAQVFLATCLYTCFTLSYIDSKNYGYLIKKVKLLNIGLLV